MERNCIEDWRYTKLKSTRLGRMLLKIHEVWHCQENILQTDNNLIRKVSC